MHPASAVEGEGRHWRDFFSPLLPMQEQQEQKQQPGTDLDGLLADVEKRYGETLAQLRQLNVQMARKQQALDDIRQDILKIQQKLDRENSQLAHLSLIHISEPTRPY